MTREYDILREQLEFVRSKRVLMENFIATPGWVDFSATLNTLLLDRRQAAFDSPMTMDGAFEKAARTGQVVILQEVLQLPFAVIKDCLTDESRIGAALEEESENPGTGE